MLQWGTKHPGESIDDIILSATSGHYEECLAEKGIDKTLYDQWKFVKSKSKAAVISTSAVVKKPVSIVLPDRSSRPTRESVAAKVGLQLEKNETVDSVEDNEKNSNNLNELATQLTFKSCDPIENGGGRVTTQNDSKNAVSTTPRSATSPNISTSPTTPSFPTTPTSPTSEESPKSSSKKPEIDLASYKAKIALLKQNLNTFNKEKENLPKIEKTEFERQSFELPPYEPLSKKEEEKDATTNKVTSDASSLLEKPEHIETNLDNSEKISSPKIDEKFSNLNLNTENIKYDGELKKISNVEAETIENQTTDEKEETKTEDQNRTLEVGYAKNIMNKLIQDTQSKVVEKRIKLIVDDSVIETDLEKNDETENESKKRVDTTVVEEGRAKELLNKWNANEIIRSSNETKTRVEIREEDGKIAESSPEMKEGVVRADETLGPINVEKGTTRGLLDQWQNRSQDNVVGKKQIVICEEDGKIAESEPVRRDDVVRCDEVEHQVSVAKGSTKQLLNSWKNMKDKQVKKTNVEIKEEDGRCVESEPVQNPDVIRADDKIDYNGSITKGKTSQLLGQWQNQSSLGSGSSSRDRTPLFVDEQDGKVVENQPAMSDMAREGYDEDTSLKSVQRGTANNLKLQWQKMNEENSYKKNKRIVISETDGKVVEKEPVTLDGVARESEVISDVVNKGQTKSLLKQWQQGNEQSQAQKQVVDVKEGMTKNLLSQWNQKSNEQFQKVQKDIIIREEDGHVSENMPSERSDEVVKSGVGPEETRGLVGQARKAKELLMNSNYKQNERKGPIKLWDETTDAQTVIENEPIQRTDVCKEEDASFDVVATKGFAKSIAGRWGKEQKEEKKEVKLEYAEGPAVYENQPAPSLKYDKHHVSLFVSMYPFFLMFHFVFMFLCLYQYLHDL